MICDLNVSQESYADFIIRYNTAEELYSTVPNQCVDFIDRDYAVAYVPLTDVEPLSVGKYTYTAIPKLYSLLQESGDITALEDSGFEAVKEQPGLALSGQGVLIGIIDTGINYDASVFRLSDGSSRILGLLDQTVGTDLDDSGITSISPPEGILYGHEFSREQLNAALDSDDPYSIVPSRDTLGHGTFLASTAVSAAPECMLGIVKLKPAKKYLRDFFLIADGIPAYQENDIMVGIKYLRQLALKLRMPLVIMLGIGSNQGSHDGTSPLDFTISTIGRNTGTAVIVAAGNETGWRHHYLGEIGADENYDDVEIRVSGEEARRGFCAELWAREPEVYSIGFISPTGETIERIPAAAGKEITIDFVLEETVITVNYRSAEIGSGSQFIFIRFSRPTAGIWHVHVFNSLYINGQYQMWLPVKGFISDETYFLRSDPNTIITNPGNASVAITAGAYDNNTDSIYIHSSRGYSRSDIIKPDIAAPGVNISGLGLNGNTVRTGTSVACAYVAGAAASLMAWGIVRGNEPAMNSSVAKAYMIRGARRSPSYIYPNREWGYGTLNLYDIFLKLRE